MDPPGRPGRRVRPRATTPRSSPRSPRYLHLKVELSGGIRDDETLERALATGCARVNIGTAALERPEWCEEIIAAYGDKIAIGLDVRGSRLAARGWTRDGGDLYETLDRLDEAGCARFVVTDVNSDGMLKGPNLDLLQRVVRRRPTSRWSPAAASPPSPTSSPRRPGAARGRGSDHRHRPLRRQLHHRGGAGRGGRVTAGSSTPGTRRRTFRPTAADRPRRSACSTVGCGTCWPGKKIVMTGVTGFIGEQLLWKILTELPDTTPAVLVRRKRSASARDRVISRGQEADLRRRTRGLRRTPRRWSTPGSR